MAKLDRLARNVAFLSALMESEVEFVCADNPDVTRLTIHILAAVAEDEQRRISERTKAALSAYKIRGGKLGAQRPECRNLDFYDRKRGAKMGAQAKREQALAYYAPIIPRLKQMRKRGHSLEDIAQTLNQEGILNLSGRKWNRELVRSVLARSK